MERELFRDAVQLAATFVALVAVFFSFIGLRHTKQAQQSHVYLDMAARYDSEEMRIACNTLLAWRRERGDGFVEDWLALKGVRDPAAMKVNEARRVVARHFVNIAKLARIRAIDRASARLLAECYGLNVFYQIAAPLNRKIADNVKTFEKLVRELKRICPAFEKGELIDSF